MLIIVTENLSRRHSTALSLSSRFQTQNAALANDGDHAMFYSKCSHTDENQTIAWLQVDLGEPYSISNVKMYYRNKGEFFLTKNINESEVSRTVTVFILSKLGQYMYTEVKI